MRHTSGTFESVVDLIDDDAIRALFSESFLTATEIYDELVDAAAWTLLESVGALPPGGGPFEVFPPTTAALSLPASRQGMLDYLTGKLVDSGLLERTRGGLRAPTGSASRGYGDVARLARELAARTPSAAVGGEIVEVLVDEGPAYLRGEKTGEEILFSPPRLPLWFRYFSNDNLLYAVNNALGAEAVARALAGRTAHGAELLEVGGGLGSAAEVVLERVGPLLSRYRFTEIVPTFLRRGERAVKAKAAAAAPHVALEVARLDMTKPWAEQGVPPASVDVVYSVNCFHVAPELDDVLREARAALRPGGAVVVSECLKPTDAFRPIYVDFVFEFLESFTSVATHPERRPRHGFLTPAAWRASFEAAGFSRVEILPDVEAIGKRYPSFFVGAVVAYA